MPFKSEEQRRYLWMKHPKIARRWSNEMAAQPEKPVPPWMSGKKIGKSKTPPGFLDAIKRRKAKMSVAGKKETKPSE